MNTGDWVESCSAIVEEMDGTFKLIKLMKTLLHIQSQNYEKILIITDAWEPRKRGCDNNDDG